MPSLSAKLQDANGCVAAVLNQPSGRPEPGEGFIAAAREGDVLLRHRPYVSLGQFNQLKAGLDLEKGPVKRVVVQDYIEKAVLQRVRQDANEGDVETLGSQLLPLASWHQLPVATESNVMVAAAGERVDVFAEQESSTVCAPQQSRPAPQQPQLPQQSPRLPMPQLQPTAPGQTRVIVRWKPGQRPLHEPGEVAANLPQPARFCRPVEPILRAAVGIRPLKGRAPHAAAQGGKVAVTPWRPLRQCALEVTGLVDKP